MIRVVVPGRPVPKARPRLGIRGRRSYIYTPESTVEYERTVALFSRQQYSKPVQGPVAVTVRIYMGRRGRGDIDNYLKSILDGLNGVVYQDDKQVVRLDACFVACSKGEERVEIEVEQMVSAQQQIGKEAVHDECAAETV